MKPEDRVLRPPGSRGGQFEDSAAGLRKLRITAIFDAAQVGGAPKIAQGIENYTTKRRICLISIRETVENVERPATLYWREFVDRGVRTSDACVFRSTINISRRVEGEACRVGKSAIKASRELVNFGLPPGTRYRPANPRNPLNRFLRYSESQEHVALLMFD